MTTGKTIALTMWNLVGKVMSLASLVAQMVKNLPAMQEIWVRSLGWEDPLEKGMATPLQYSCLENPMDRDWQATVNEVARVGHDLAAKPPPPYSLRDLDPQ